MLLQGLYQVQRCFAKHSICFQGVVTPYFEIHLSMRCYIPNGPGIHYCKVRLKQLTTFDANHTDTKSVFRGGTTNKKPRDWPCWRVDLFSVLEKYIGIFPARISKVHEYSKSSRFKLLYIQQNVSINEAQRWQLWKECWRQWCLALCAYIVLLAIFTYSSEFWTHSA